MPLMQLKMLVLPAPLGPMTAKNWPASTARLTPPRAATPPKLRCRSSRASNVTLVHPLVIAPCGERTCDQVGNHPIGGGEDGPKRPRRQALVSLSCLQLRQPPAEASRIRQHPTLRQQRRPVAKGRVERPPAISRARR